MVQFFVVCKIMSIFANKGGLLKSTISMNTLLIIDDEPIIRKLLSRMMELEGYEVGLDHGTNLRCGRHLEFQHVIEPA